VKSVAKKVFRSFTLELPIYAALAIAYVVLVLHYLGHWLFQLFKDERDLYAIVALTLIVGQGYVLELVTRGLFGIIRGKKEK
jgi:Kef-type K+ transport system membrane component KefB